MTRSTQNLRRRSLVLLMVVGLLLAAAGAAAAKPGSPKPPNQATVTMAGDLATTCPGFAPSVTMTLDGSTLEGRRLNLSTDIGPDQGLTDGWNRIINVGYGTSGSALTGCHGNALPGNETDLYPLIISLNVSQQQVKIQWRFDPAFDSQGDPQELFELISNPHGLRPGPVAWVDGVVEGDFLLHRWNAGTSWTELGTVHLTFELTVPGI